MKKRIFSLALATVMSISMSTVAFAEDPPGKWDAGAEDYEVTGEGDTKYVDTEVVSVTLPTNDALGFTLDPIGLVSMGEGDETALEDLAGGMVVGDDVANIINESSRPIKLSVDIGVTGDATVIATEKADVEEPAADGDTPAPNNVLLYAVASSEDVSEAVTKDDFIGSENGFILGETDITLDFALSAAEYVVKNTDGVFTTELTEDTGHGTALMIGGFCNTLANWEAFADGGASTVGVAAKFTYALDTDAMAAAYEESDYETVSGTPAAIHLLAADTPREATDVIKAEGLVAAPAGPSISKAYTYKKGTAGGFTVAIANYDKWESGASKAFTSGNFVLASGGTTVNLTNGTNCTWNATTGVLNLTATKGFDAASVLPGVYNLTFKIGATTFETKVTVTAA